MWQVNRTQKNERILVATTLGARRLVLLSRAHCLRLSLSRRGGSHDTGWRSALA